MLVADVNTKDLIEVMSIRSILEEFERVQPREALCFLVKNGLRSGACISRITEKIEKSVAKTRSKTKKAQIQERQELPRLPRV